MTDRMVLLTIDGQEVTAPLGSTIYEAATKAGIHIPTFCHHPKLVPVGACRMCLVEIEGARGLQTSCTTPVREGMIVKVHTSPAAVKARKANIEFLLTNHPLDCPVCDKGGECPLQDQALLDGPGQSRYIEEKRHKNKRYPLSELIVLDQERCVLCWRCIRFLDEWADDHQLDLFGRGAGTRIDTAPHRAAEAEGGECAPRDALRSKWQGNTIDICPVGALTSRVFRFEARVWELTNTDGICPLCAVGCNVVLGVKNNELRRITPRENLEVNDAWICDKGRFGHAFVDHPERLTAPLVRRAGRLEPASWDEALDLVASRFAQIVQDAGPGAIAGVGSTRVTNEANYLFQRFMRSVVGSNSVDHMGRMPARALPLSSLPELERRDLIVLLGCDPSTEAPLVELWIKKAVLRHGARVLAIHPRRIELADAGARTHSGARWLGYRPGSEVALMNGLAHAILDLDASGQQGTGPKGRARRVSNIEDVLSGGGAESWLSAYAPKKMERVTGVPARTVQQAAQVLVEARHPIVLYGPDWVHGPATEAKIDALANLTLLLDDLDTGFVAADNNTLGALDMGVVPDLYPGGQPLSDHKIRNRLASLWGGKPSPVDGLNFEAMMEAGKNGGLGAMWIMGADPANDCQLAGEALGQIPFLVVQDLFLTDTASLAEVVLPAATFTETDGCFTNLTGRWQAVHAARRPPGLARPDWWIITELAKRMVGEKQQKSWTFAAPGDVLAEICRILPRYRDLSYAAMGASGWQPPAQEVPSRRAFVRVEVDLPSHDPEYPLILLPGRLLYDRGTLLLRSERLQHLVPGAFVVIHPTDAGRLDLVDGDAISVVSAQGRLGFTVCISDEIVPGTVFAPLNLSDAPLSVLFTRRQAFTPVRLEK